MKRYENLYQKICSMDNLKEAHRNARKGKGWYAEVKEVDTHLEEYLTSGNACQSHLSHIFL